MPPAVVITSSSKSHARSHSLVALFFIYETVVEYAHGRTHQRQQPNALLMDAAPESCALNTQKCESTVHPNLQPTQKWCFVYGLRACRDIKHTHARMLTMIHFHRQCVLGHSLHQYSPRIVHATREHQSFLPTKESRSNNVACVMLLWSPLPPSFFGFPLSIMSAACKWDPQKAIWKHSLSEMRTWKVER